MTLENCIVLLKHFENIVSGVEAKQPGHRNWDLVLKQANEQIPILKERVAWKKTKEFRIKHERQTPEDLKEDKPEEEVKKSVPEKTVQNKSTVKK